MSDDEVLDFGPCCECRDRPANCIVLLPRRAAVPGTGWGCAECSLPSDGAVAVLCKECLVALGGEAPRFVCKGYAASHERMPTDDLAPDIFEHDREKHEMLPRGRWHSSLTNDVIMEACERRLSTLDNPGFCLICGGEAAGVEPDARNYECEGCGSRQVFGAEELLLVIM